jgi:glyoxylase-like metal-dependent hydrolase (beta-lactamase superfamily II)
MNNPTPIYPLPLNPGATADTVPPPFITWLPQEADITLVGQKTNCYLVHGSEGIWVVDPPSAKELPIAEIVEAGQEQIVGIWLTHAHPDHTGGVATLATSLGVSVYAHPRAWEAVIGDIRKIEVQEGDVIDGWEVYYLPGHRFDHLAFIHQESRVALVGDLVAGSGSVIIDPGDGDLFDYFASLHRLRDELNPSILLPGHGPLSADPATLITFFIQHRLKREQMVLDALTHDPQPISALLPLAYNDTPSSLFPMAERALLTQLRKLEREGRAVQLGEGWQLVSSD